MTDDLRATIAHNLTNLLSVNDIEAKMLAEWVGVDPSMVSAWKAGIKAMSLTRALRVAKVLRVTVEELCGE